jgi:hypothetical protein
MATPMVTNLKKVVTSYSELVDPRIYMQADRVLDVFGQHQARYFFCCEHLELVHGGAKAGALDHNKACAQVLERYSGVWIEISWRIWSGVAGIYRLILGRECSRQKEHLGVLLQLGINNDYLVQQEANFCSTQFSRGRVYGNEYG